MPVSATQNNQPIKSNKSASFRFFRNIHLYLSLAAGLVIMTCCFTGAVLVFEKDLLEAFNNDRYYVKPGPDKVTIGQVISNVKAKYPAATVASVKVHNNPGRSVEVGVSIAPKQKQNDGAEGLKPIVEIKKAAKAPASPRASHTVFANPYNGKVLELYSYRETFFYTMFALHRWLLGGDDSIGKTITGVATLIFLFILITGIVLWWPRNKAILQQRLKIKSDANWKRFNHDLHIVLGFYSAIFLFIFSFTALAWSFKWFNDGIYKVTGSSMKPAEPPKSIYVANQPSIGFDDALQTVQTAAPHVHFYTLRPPADSIAPFTVNVLPTGVHEGASDNYYVDQYSNKIIGSLKFADKNLGQRVRSTFKPVHVGSIYGLPSKIIAFVVCVLGVSFPITGTIMWINRLKKKK